MHHREIYEAVSRVIRNFAARGGFRMMDLGCGNARCMAPILRRYPPRSYEGVDLSETALAEASEFLSGIDSVSFRRADLLEHAESEKSPRELIFSGFAVHHLQTGEKKRLFRALAGITGEDGAFLMVDVVKEEGMTREDHVRSYTGMMRNGWHGIPPEALEEGCAHVAAYDFPATATELSEDALEAGFAVSSEICRHGPHRAILFSRNGSVS